MAAAVLLVLAAPDRASAQTRVRHFDPQGRYLGRAGTSGGTTRFFDAQGRLRGRAEGTSDPHGTSAALFDAQGRCRGRIEGR